MVSLLHWQPSPARWRKFSGEVAGFSRACGKFSPVYALSKHFERFSGLQNAEFSQDELIQLMNGLKPEGEEMIRQLHETGVISFSSGEILTRDSKIIVPRLFRSGLGIITMGRP